MCLYMYTLIDIHTATHTRILKQDIHVYKYLDLLDVIINHAINKVCYSQTYNVSAQIYCTCTPFQNTITTLYTKIHFILHMLPERETTR